MRKHGELWRAASVVVGEGGLAMLTTANAEGQPHATWMNAVVDHAIEEVLTATAPNSRKVENIEVNPRVEWMFASRSMETLVYLEGRAEIVQDESEAEACWHRIPRRSEACFRRFCILEDHRRFAMIRTRVERVIYCRPQGYRKTVVHEDEALALSS